MRSCAPHRAATPCSSRYSCNWRSMTSAASSRASSRSSSKLRGRSACWRAPSHLRAAFEQRLGRRIHDFDLVRLVEKVLRDAVRGALAGDPLDVVLLLADVLHIERGDDADAAVEQVAHILPALRIAAAGRIALRQAVDQADLRMAAEEGHQVDGASVRLGNRLRGGRPPPESRARPAALQRRHDYILPARPCGGGLHRTCATICPRAAHSPERPSAVRAIRGVRPPERGAATRPDRACGRPTWAWFSEGRRSGAQGVSRSRSERCSGRESDRHGRSRRA